MSIARKLLMSSKNRFIPDWIINGIPPLTNNGQDGDVLYGYHYGTFGSGSSESILYSESQANGWEPTAYKMFDNNLNSFPNQIPLDWTKREAYQVGARYLDPKGYPVRFTHFEMAGSAYQSKEYGGPSPGLRSVSFIIPVTGRQTSITVPGYGDPNSTNRAYTWISIYNHPNPGTRWNTIDTIANQYSLLYSDLFPGDGYPGPPQPTFSTPFYLVTLFVGYSSFSAQYPNCFTPTVKNSGTIATVELAT